jgi:hypothetical protein
MQRRSEGNVLEEKDFLEGGADTPRTLAMRRNVTPHNKNDQPAY